LVVIIVCPLRIERRGAGCKIALDHAGDDGARLVEIERSNGRVHSVELLAGANSQRPKASMISGVPVAWCGAPQSVHSCGTAKLPRIGMAR
jgi:hypothetical protein